MISISIQPEVCNHRWSTIRSESGRCHGDNVRQFTCGCMYKVGCMCKVQVGCLHPVFDFRWLRALRNIQNSWWLEREKNQVLETIRKEHLLLVCALRESWYYSAGMMLMLHRTDLQAHFWRRFAWRLALAWENLSIQSAWFLAAHWCESSWRIAIQDQKTKSGRSSQT